MLSHLRLTDVRNHADLTLTPGPGFVMLTGGNGAGKTNILEAVSLLAPGRGLRRAALSQIARTDGPGGFGIAGTLAQGTDLVTGTLAAAPERRVVRINGAPAAATMLAEWLTVLWLTPAMDRLFVEPASERRRFLDRLTLALSPGHAVHANRYDAAMRARNRLLAEERAPDRMWLDGLEREMALHGVAVDRARRETVVALEARLSIEPASPFAHASIAIAGEAVEQDALVAALAGGRQRDAAAGRALVGPHRADLLVRHVDKHVDAALASTGEQKALLLGIVLAHSDLVAARTGRTPVLLLDEVAAHLDPTRRAALFERLTGKGQVWMTGTEAALFDAIDDATRIAVGGRWT